MRRPARAHRGRSTSGLAAEERALRAAPGSRAARMRSPRCLARVADYQANSGSGGARAGAIAEAVLGSSRWLRILRTTTLSAPSPPRDRRGDGLTPDYPPGRHPLGCPIPRGRLQRRSRVEAPHGAVGDRAQRGVDAREEIVARAVVPGAGAAQQARELRGVLLQLVDLALDPSRANAKRQLARALEPRGNPGERVDGVRRARSAACMHRRDRRPSSRPDEISWKRRPTEFLSGPRTELRSGGTCGRHGPAGVRTAPPDFQDP